METTINGAYVPGVNGTPVQRGRVTRRYKSHSARTKKSTSNKGGGNNKKDKYHAEQIAFYMILALLGSMGIYIAVISSGGNPLIMVGQVSGFVASTFFIKTLYSGIRDLRYTGSQYDYAKRLALGGLSLEGLTLAAKYIPGFITPYLMIMAFTVPLQAIAIFKLIYMDPERVLERRRKSNERKKKWMQEMIKASQEERALDHELALIKAAKITQKNHDDKLIKKANGKKALRTADKAADVQLNSIFSEYINVESGYTEPIYVKTKRPRSRKRRAFNIWTAFNFLKKPAPKPQKQAQLPEKVETKPKPKNSRKASGRPTMYCPGVGDNECGEPISKRQTRCKKCKRRAAYLRSKGEEV